MWEKAAEIPGDQTRGTAPNLTEGEEYQFRVIAVNQAGPGEPSEPSTSVIAKPRFGTYGGHGRHAAHVGQMTRRLMRTNGAFLV